MGLVGVRSLMGTSSSLVSSSTASQSIRFSENSSKSSEMTLQRWCSWLVLPSSLVAGRESRAASSESMRLSYSSGLQ